MEHFNGSVIMTEQEYTALSIKANEADEAKHTAEKLTQAIIALYRKGSRAEAGADVELPRSAFLAIYNEALNRMFNNDDESDIYGKDVTVHWNGFFCNCLDGAESCENIIGGVQAIYDSMGDLD